jgi:hypothetical protein
MTQHQTSDNKSHQYDCYDDLESRLRCLLFKKRKMTCDPPQTVRLTCILIEFQAPDRVLAVDCVELSFFSPTLFHVMTLRHIETVRISVA